MQYKEAMKRMNCYSGHPQHVQLSPPSLLNPPITSSSEVEKECVLNSSSLLPTVNIQEGGLTGRQCSTVSDTDTNSNYIGNEGSEGVQRSSLANRVISAMKVIVPIKIALLFAKLLLILYFLEDIKHLVQLWYMPVLGVVAACLANCVPIGGGIVYVPALALLGSDMSLGVSFSVATMTVGNGIFGYLHWQRKDPSLLVWEAIPFTVLPSSLGTLASVFITPPSEAVVKTSFALFCFLLAVFVFFCVHKGGMARVVHDYSWTRNSKSNNTCRRDGANIEDAGMMILTWTEWLPLTAVSFFAGVLLVPNIAIGPSLTTFLGLVLLGFHEKAAMVTGIVVGGWASIVPFLLHASFYEDVPWDLWMMVLPGVALGAWLAPQVQTLIGMENSLIAFGIFLLCTFILFMTH
jgi:uncharacterized membrane protein YfcA